MAYNNTRAYLGYEDEYITEKHKGIVNFITNKVGGKPDWPSHKNIENPVCDLCQLPRPLVLQIYAPLEGSPYHRTLYLFGCINPNCWNHNESWACIRVQAIENTLDSISTSETTNTLTTSATEWCQEADDWDDDNNVNINEENGNIVNNIERISDEDDESCSFEESIRMGLGNLSVDDRNANKGLSADAQGGAVGRLNSPRATAEIEGDEGEVISIDTPTSPQHNLTALLQEATPLPHDVCQSIKSGLTKFSAFQFVPFFISVFEETTNSGNLMDRHVKELLLEYQQKNDDLCNAVEESGGCSEESEENYEKSTPAHGDKMFHYFLTKIRSNPGQILRYSRDGAPPLLLNPLNEVLKKCEYCDGEMIFEIQLLPTLIPKLRLTCDVNEGARLEFGTILIFTCRRSCWSTDADIRKEYIILQTEKY